MSNEQVYKVYLFSLIDDEEKIKSYFELGFKGNISSLAMENHEINIETIDGSKLLALASNQNIDEESKEFFESLINTIWNEFRVVETDRPDIKINLLHQIKLFKSVYEVRFQADTKEQVSRIMNGIFDTCYNCGGLILNGSGTVFGDENNKTVLNDEGDSELEAYFVKELKNTIDESACTKEALDRRNRSMTQLSEHQIYVPRWLQVIETKEEALFRTKEEIAKRLVALTLTAIYSEGIMGAKWSPKKSFEYIKPYIEALGAEKYFSKKEAAYLSTKEPEEEIVISYSWNYEHAWVMFWALGFIETLDYPSSICNVGLLANTIKGFSSMEELLEGSSIRSEEEILDEADLIYRYNWACIDVRSQMGLPAPGDLDPSIVYDRNKALNWLIGYGGADWDEVLVEA